ncbi:hypothetical protein TI06_22925, partial [Vibrio vulnificus]
SPLARRAPGAIQGTAGEAGRGLLDQRYLTADLQGGDGVELDLDLQEAHGALGRDVLGDALDVLVAQFQTVLLEVVDTLDQLARLVVADVAAVVGLGVVEQEPEGFLAEL